MWDFLNRDIRQDTIVSGIRKRDAVIWSLGYGVIIPKSLLVNFICGALIIRVRLPLLWIPSATITSYVRIRMGTGPINPGHFQ
jgi:hypothetical protein